MTFGEVLIAGVLMIMPVQAEVPRAEGSAECLALNMYHEARDQGVGGALAVSFVVFNRVKDNRLEKDYLPRQLSGQVLDVYDFKEINMKKVIIYMLHLKI